MLVSKTIKSVIEKEIKAQKAYLATLEKQEKNYEIDMTEEKSNVKNSISYYEKILKEE